MNRFLRVCMVLAALPLMMFVFAQADPEELAARQADETNAFWNPDAEDLESWRGIDNIEEGAEITFWTMSLSPTFDEYLQQIVANFEKTYPNVDVTWEDVPYTGLQAKFRNALAAGNAPDLVNLGQTWVSEFAGADQLMSVDELISAYPDLREHYSDTAWNTSDYEGVSYDLPWYLALANFTAYNEAMLAEHGYTAEDLPQTWAELEAFAREWREQTGGYATSLNFVDSKGRYLLQYLKRQGVDFPTDGSPVDLATPRAVEALQIWVDLIQDDLIPLRSLTDDTRAMTEYYSQGNTPFVPTAPHLLRIVEENNPEVRAYTKLTQGIVGSTGGSGITIQALAIPKQTDYPQAALALATFVTNPETFTEFSKWAGVYPSNMLSFEDPYFSSSEGGQSPAIRALAEDYIRNAVNVDTTFPANNPKIEEVTVQATQQALLGGKSAEEALTWLSEQINQILAEADAESAAGE